MVRAVLKSWAPRLLAALTSGAKTAADTRESRSMFCDLAEAFQLA